MLDPYLGLFCKGPTYILDCLIEITKDDWDTVTEVLAGYLIQNYDENYNNMVSLKEFTKTDPKDAKIISLPTCLTKLWTKNFCTYNS